MTCMRSCPGYMTVALLLTWTATASSAAGGFLFEVTNTNDSGPGSLRQAIHDANGITGTADTIVFVLEGSPQHVAHALESHLDFPVGHLVLPVGQDHFHQLDCRSRGSRRGPCPGPRYGLERIRR